MNLIEFLVWLYSGLCWYVMATFVFAPIKDEKTGEIYVAFNTPLQHNTTLAQNRRNCIVALLLAPAIWPLVPIIDPFIREAVDDAVNDAEYDAEYDGMLADSQP